MWKVEGNNEGRKGFDNICINYQPKILYTALDSPAPSFPISVKIRNGHMFIHQMLPFNNYAYRNGINQSTGPNTKDFGESSHL